VESEEVYGEVAALASSITSMLGLDRLKPSEEDVEKASVFYRQLLSRAQETYGKGQIVGHSTVITNLQAAGLSFEQASGVLAVVLLAGTETVSVALPRITALLVDTGQLKRLSERRELLPNAIVEGLRVVVPSHVILRSVAEDAELDGMEFKKGERVIVIISNALKQSKYFPKPGRFDIEREVESRFKHLCFGAGPHFCLGFALAHREIAAFIEALLDLPGEARVVSRKYPRNMNFPSYVSLKVRVQKT
jgi:cytochrome P450